MYQLDFSAIQLPPGLSKKVYFYRVGDSVLVDMSDHDTKLQGKFMKPSEFRRVIWKQGIVIRRQLFDTSRATLAAKFLVKVDDGKSFWFYHHRMKPAPDMDH